MNKPRILIIVFLIALSICALANMPAEAQSSTLSQFVFSTVSNSQTAGKAFSITITAKSSTGNTVTSYTGTNTLTVSSGTITPTSTGAFTAGVWTGQVTLSQAGTGISISTSGGGKSGKSNSFTVNPGALDHFIFNSIATQTVGTAFSITVTAKDLNENTVTSYTGTNTLSASSGTISPTSTSKFTSGIWTGSVTLSVSGSEISIGTFGSSKFGRSNYFTVNAIVLDHFIFNTISSPQTAGSAFTTTITAKASNGNTVTSYTGRPTLSASTGTINPTMTGAFSNGVWTGTITTTGAGSGITITATDSTHSGQSNSFTINPGAATRLEVSCGISQVAGIAFPVMVTAKDAYGNTAKGYTGRIHFTSTDSGSGVRMPSDYKFQSGDLGTHTFSNGVTLMTAGTGISITAIDTVTSSITGSQTGITVTRNAQVANIVISPANSSVTAGVTTTFSALASDAYGNTWDVTSLMNWSISSGADGFWSNNVYTSATAGYWIVNSIYASTVYSTGLTVNPAGLDHFVFNAIGTQTAGSAFGITITAKDLANNTVTSYAGMPSLTFSAGSISPSSANGTFSNGVWTGTVTVTGPGLSVSITATDGRYTGTSNLFTVNPTISASAGAGGAITPTGNITVNYGGSQSFNITTNVGYYIVDVVVDNVSLGSVSSYTFNFVQVPHTITATFAINMFNITASAGSGGSISPNGSVSIIYGESQTFNVTANTGYFTVDVLVNGSSVGAINSYTFTNVQASNTISATFGQTPSPTPSVTPNPESTSTPSPTPKPTPSSSPTPSPTPTPTPTPLITTIQATTESGATINLEIKGNITSSQISNATITSNQTAKTTAISFTITGPNSTTGFCNMTIPKTAILYGTNPTIYLDNQQTPNQGYTQDSDNFYVWYTTQFSTHQAIMQFTAPSTLQTSSFGVLLAVGITVPEIILIYTVIALKRLRRKPEHV